ncbi:MAG: hypothetical protein WCO84_02935 [bacterium]
MKYKIGVAGVGMVGAQVKKWFELKKFEVFAYDSFKNIGKFEDLQSADIVFVCLPTPHSKRSDTGVDVEVFKKFFRNFNGPKIFVIKSTVPPGTTEFLQEAFPDYSFLHSPEFLTESTAWEDFSKPVFQLLGYTEKSKNIANDVIKILPRGKVNEVVRSNESEIFKFTRNAFFAMKVIFANQIYDLSQKFGADYDVLKKLMLADPWIGGHHLEVIHKGYRGFGGKCLPKDLKTFIKVFEKKRVTPSLFNVVDQINETMLKKQKLGETLKKYWLGNYNEPEKK